MEGTTKGTPTASVVLRAPSPHLGHLQGWGAATSLGHCAHFINYNSLAKVKSSLQHVERQALGRTLLNENLYNIVMLSHAEEEASPAWSVCSGQDGVSQEDRHTVTGGWRPQPSGAAGRFWAHSLLAGSAEQGSAALSSCSQKDHSGSAAVLSLHTAVRL